MRRRRRDERRPGVAAFVEYCRGEQFILPELKYGGVVDSDLASGRFGPERELLQGLLAEFPDDAELAGVIERRLR